MSLPLAGVRVLAIEQYGAGPFGTLFLADQGAEVIKIEDPASGGDYARALGPHFFENGESQFWHTFNRNKKSLTLDLKTTEGQAVFRDLVASADATACNLRGDVPEKLGVTYDALKDVNPKIVCAHLSAYGRHGSRKTWPGFDFLMQAEAGQFSVTGEPSGPPQRCGVSLVDLMTGVGMAFAVAAAVLGARTTGEGRDIDITLFDIAHSFNCYTATWYLNSGFVQGRSKRSAHASLVPCQLYKTADGWIYLMCNKEKFWPVLCDAVGHPEWAQDARFKTFKERLENRDAIQDLLDHALSQKTTADWLGEFGGAVPAAPCFDIAEALDNPFLDELGTLQDIEIDGLPARLLDSPVRSSTPTPANPAPKLGVDTEGILAGIGYDQAKIDNLKQKKII